MLIARPKFLPDESIASIFLRAADLNGWPNVRSMLIICRPLAPILTGALRSRERFSQYAAYLGIEFSMQSGPYQGGRVFGEKGIELTSRVGLPDWAVRPDGSALCPACLTEDEHPYLRRSWQIKLNRACHFHGCLLLEDCDHCNNRLTWDRPAPHRCNCGFDLRNSARIPGDQASAMAIRDLISSGAHERLNIIARSFNAYVNALGIANDPSTQDNLLRELNSREGKEKGLLKTKVLEKLDIEHPRLLLLPLLKTNHLKETAQSLLRDIRNIQISSRSDGTLSGQLTLADAAVVLGVSSQRIIILLCKEKIFEMTKPGKTPHGNIGSSSVSRASCDALLRELSRRTENSVAPTQMRPPTSPLFDFILRLHRHPADNAGYDLETGFSSLRSFITEPPRRANEIHGVREADYVTHESAAMFLGIGKYLIPSLVKIGWLSGAIDPAFPIRKIVSRKSVTAFNERYICSVKIAKALGVKATGNFSMKFNDAGIYPIGGPGIDGSMVRIFCRADLVGKYLLGQLPSNQDADKLRSQSYSLEAVISLAAVIHKLKITLPQAKRLVNRNLICRVQTPSVQVMVSKKSFDAYFEKWKDENLIERCDAASIIGESEIQFIMRWVASGIVKTVDLGLRVCVHFNDIERIKMIKQRYVFAVDCQKIWLVGRFELPNMEKRGLIKSSRFGLHRPARLYLRRDVEALLGPNRKTMEECCVEFDKIA